MARIIPGVQVTVIKEVVPPQLAPSGVLGLVGLVAPKPESVAARKPVERVSSWGRFRELYGSSTALAMPQAQQALQNGVFELVVVEVDSSVAEFATADVQYSGSNWLAMAARCSGTAANSLRVVVKSQTFQDEVQGYELRVIDDSGEAIEVYRGLSPFPGAPRWIETVLAASDSIVEATAIQFTDTDYSGGGAETLTLAGDQTVAATVGAGPSQIDVLTITKNDGGTPPISFVTNAGTLTITRDPGGTPEVLLSADAAASTILQDIITALEDQADIDIEIELPPIDSDVALAGGVDASVAEYTDALEQLVDVPDVDLVIASVQDLDADRASQIYGAVIAHCDNMATDAKGRLGFGQVPASTTIDENIDLVGSLISDRFVLFAPHGVMGAAVGRIGSLPYFQSPTFKGLAGLGTIEPALRLVDQRSYLRNDIVPIAELQGRGNVVVRGLTTDGDQINVRRVADRAVRGVKQIGELFIGKLNTEDGRNALKQKLNEFLLQMASENAIVPSTDGSDPAFKLDVFSTQADFALGIVRVDIAVRPVRAIDFIYATVLVQV